MMEETEENSETIISDHNTELGGMMARVTMMSDIKDIDKLLRVPAPGTRAATEFMARYGTGENNLRNLRNIQVIYKNTTSELFMYANIIIISTPWATPLILLKSFNSRTTNLRLRPSRLPKRL